MDGDAAESAELDVSQSRAAEISENSRPVDFAGRLSHGGASGDSQTGPILTTLRRALKMRFTGRTPYNSQVQEYISAYNSSTGGACKLMAYEGGIEAAAPSLRHSLGLGYNP